MSEPLQQKRTKLEALHGLKYEIRLHYTHARLYRRLRAMVAFIGALGSASAFTSALAGSPRLIAVGGMLLAVCGFADLVLDFGKKATEHELTRKAYCKVEERWASLSLSQADAEMASIKAEDPGHIESLRWPAQNDVLRSEGFIDHVKKLSWLERFFNLIA